MKFSVRDEIIEVVNKLFVYTDGQDWNKLIQEVFSDKINFDMSSLGGDQSILTSEAICEIWRNGFMGIDSVNHLAGNYIVQINDTNASVFAYATATHFKATATKGKTREFIGTYNIDFSLHKNGWRIVGFKYNLKYVNGNIDLS
jgi:hypothetical protein